jgi:hypothetical protein
LAVRIGTKTVVCLGLMALAIGFFWVAHDDAGTGYQEIWMQMVTVGSGLGLTSAPATEAIMGVVPAAKAGIGSAVNDATRELGGTLGVAVIGSIALSIYRSHLADSFTDPSVLKPAQDSLGGAAAVAARVGDPNIVTVAQQGFVHGLSVGCTVAGAVCLFGAVLAALFLPAHPVARSDEDLGGPSAVPARDLTAEPRPALVSL